MPQARIGDLLTCAGAPDVIASGAATVLVGGLPAARLTDKTVHAGLLVQGSLTVLIGDPAFSVPANMTIGGTPTFQSQVVRDLYFLSTIPSGRDLLNQLAASGQPINFVPFAGQNSWCTAANGANATNGTGTGSTIQYNPNIAVNGFDSAGNQIPIPPQLVLGHEMCHALANAQGRQQSTAPSSDPSPPASQPNIDAEESQAIGTGSFNGQSPSENSLRSDLGLPRRDNHFGVPSGPPGPAATNLRPGGP